MHALLAGGRKQRLIDDASGNRAERGSNGSARNGGPQHGET